MRIIWGAAVVAMVLAGCKASHPDAGSGPIILSPAITQHFEEYKARPGRDLYVVTVDGKRGVMWTCGSGANCTGGGQPGNALASCESTSKGVPCRVFAVGDAVVWDGPVTYGRN
jgi:hypothetical protein